MRLCSDSYIVGYIVRLCSDRSIRQWMSSSLGSGPTDDCWKECANGRIKIYIAPQPAHSISVYNIQRISLDPGVMIDKAI